MRLNPVGEMESPTAGAKDVAVGSVPPLHASSVVAAIIARKPHIGGWPHALRKRLDTVYLPNVAVRTTLALHKAGARDLVLLRRTCYEGAVASSLLELFAHRDACCHPRDGPIPSTGRRLDATRVDAEEPRERRHAARVLMARHSHSLRECRSNSGCRSLRR